MTTYLVRRDLIAVLERQRLRVPHGGVSMVAVIEIDRLAELSTLHGRAIVEQVIQQLAVLVRRLAHELDVVERFYDDLLVIVPHDSIASVAERSVEAIRAAIEGHGFDPGGLRVTASIGLASGEANYALDQARSDVRWARLLGGNRVVAWDGDRVHGHKAIDWPDDTLVIPSRREN